MSNNHNRPRWQSLGWFKARGLWRTSYKGHRLYLSGDGSKEKTRKSHDLALTQLEQRKAAIDNEKSAANPQYIQAAEKHERFADLMAETAQTDAERERAIALRQHARDLRAQSNNPDAPKLHSFHLDPLSGISEQGKAVWNDRARRRDQRRKHGDTLSDHINDFIKRQQVQADNEKKSSQRVASVKGCLCFFSDWFGPSRSIYDVDARSLENYHTYLLSLEISDYTKRDRIKSVKQFIKQRASLDLMQLPSNIDSSDLVFNVQPKEPDPMPLEDYLALLNNASDYPKLILLLFLNCGFNHTDIANLRHTELDLTNATITRQRSKTANRKSSNVPTVTYPLWAETLRLLKTHLSNDETYALLSPTSKYLNRDTVYRIASKPYNKTNVNYKLKTIRKLGATLIANNFNWSLAHQYLGDAPSGIAAKHYIKPNHEQFAHAIQWLGRQVNL